MVARSVSQQAMVGCTYRLLTALVVSALVLTLFAPPGLALAFSDPIGRPLGDEPPRPLISGKGQVSISGPMGVQVNTYNGNLYYEYTAFYFPALLPLEFTLTYNSLRRNYAPVRPVVESQGIQLGQSALGAQGWQHNYDIYYERVADGDVLVTLGDGNTLRFGLGAPSTGIQMLDYWYTSPPGVRATLVRTQNGRYVLAAADQVVYFFDSDRHRRVTRVQHPGGQSLVFEYNAQGLPTRISHSFGQRLELSYVTVEGVPRLSAVTDPLATPPRQVQLGYQVAGDLETITDPAGQVTRFGYVDAGLGPAGTAGNLALGAIDDPMGNRLGISYAQGRVIRLGAYQQLTYLSYDLQQSQTTVLEVGDSVQHPLLSLAEATTAPSTNRDPGTWANYTYDARGRVSQVRTPSGTRHTLWDDQDNPVQVTDEAGHSTGYRYDERGNLLAVTDPLGRTTRFTYHPVMNLVTSIIEANGDTTVYDYDAGGNLVGVTLPNGGVQRYGYDAHGLLISDTTPLGHTSFYGYDGYGHLSEIRDTLGYTTTFVTDHQGNLLLESDADGNTLGYGYDSLGRLVALVDGLGRETTFAYDPNSNLTEVADPAGFVNRYDYDPLGRLVRVVDPLGNVTGYGYSPCGNLTDIRDAAGYTTSFSYNDRGRLRSATDPLGHRTSYLYDQAGDLVRRTDASGAVTSYLYDDAGQLAMVDYPGSDADLSLSYDLVGNVLTHTNAAVSVARQYDALRGVTDVQVDAVSLWTKSAHYEYNAAGQRVSMIDPDGGETTYEYTARGELAAITNPAGERTDFEYAPAGRLVRRDYANGTYTVYSYDAAGQPASVTHFKSSGQVIAGFTYEYNATGNPIRVTEADGLETRYSYDPLGRLIEVVYPDSRVVGYTYDAVGNRLQASDSVLGTTAYIYNEANQLVSQVTPTQTVTYSYDPNGNLVSRADASGIISYTYDWEGNLVGIAFPDGRSQSFAVYPGTGGLRLSQMDPTGQLTTAFYDGQNTLMEMDPTGNSVARYTAGPEYDDWISLERGGASYTYHRDALGSVVALTGASQSVVATYRYDAFGNPLAQTGAVVNPYRFAGRAYQAESGLYYNRARTYDPRTGRFLSPDPVAGTRFDPQTLNPYPYVLNNPAGFVDPTGQFIFIVVGAVLVAGGVFYGLVQVNRWAEEVHQAEADAGQVLTVRALRNSRSTTAWAQTAHRLQDRAQRKRVVATAKATEKGFEMVREVAEAIMPKPDLPDDFTKQLIGETGEAIKQGYDYAQKAKGVGEKLGTFFGPGSGGPGLLPGDQGQSGADGYTGEGAYEGEDRDAPHRPGNDHQDDTASVASPQFPGPAPTGLTTFGLGSTAAVGDLAPVYRANPRVALLWNGFAQEAAAFLSALGEPFSILYPDSPPDLAALYPVLLIPSGGLYGLENSASFRARLESYVAQGGVVLVSAQQHGYEFSALPGGLGGYGWAEDQSCFDAAVRFPQYHPALASFNRESLNLLVDGYFSGYPAGATVLLERNKNGYPSALLYPYGDGYVMATTVYADWGSSNYQYSRDDHRVWRDLIEWATLGALPGYGHALPDWGPGEVVTASLRIENNTGDAAAAVRLIQLSPGKTVAEQRVVTTTIDALTAVTLPYTTTTGSDLGIWSVDYVLLDSDGFVLQEQAIGAAYVVSDPAESIGPSRPWDLWITAATEYFIQGSTGEFVVHARNRTADPIGNAIVSYWFPHHAYENRPGTSSWFCNLGTVQPGDEATCLVERAILTNDRLFAHLTSNQGGGQLTSFQIRMLPAAARVQVEPAQDIYVVGQTVTVTTEIVNTQPSGYSATVRLRAFDPNQVPFGLDEQPITFAGPGSVATLGFTLTMPVTPTFGLHTVQVEVMRDGQPVGFDQAHFDLPAPYVAVSIQGPAGYRLNQTNSVDFRLQNQSGSPVADGTLAVKLRAPGGETPGAVPGPVLWQSTEAISLAPWGTVTLTHGVPLSTALGVYTLEYETTCLGRRLSRGSRPVAAAYAVTLSKDKPRYAGGETMGVSVLVENIGDLVEPLEVRLAVPAAGYSQVEATTPEPEETASLFYSVALPAMITAGVQPMTVSLTTAAGSSATNDYQFVILPANLRLALGAGPYQAGTGLPVVATNAGGGMTGFSGQLLLRDSGGRLVAVSSAVGTLAAGQSQTHFVSVPADVQSGLYTLQANYYAHATGQPVELRRVVTVEGMEADLEAAAARTVYRSGEAITATAWVTNTGDYPMNGASLGLEAVSMLGGGPLAGLVLNSDGQPVIGARVTLDAGQAVWTNLAGEYRLESVGVGEHLLQVERAGYQDYSQVHFVAGPQEPVTLTLFPPPAVELSGTVRVSGGVTIVVGADVQVGGAQPAHLRTGPAGTYHLVDLAPGTWPMTVTAPGFQPYTGTVVLSEGVNLLDVDLTPGQTGLHLAQRMAWGTPVSLSLAQTDGSQTAAPSALPSSHRRAPGPMSPPQPLAPARPETNVSGAISVDTTWTITNSPYVLTGDVTVNSGVTLTVQPGVVVKGYDAVQLKVLGRLVATGTPTQPITFTSSADTGPDQWDGLLFDGGTGHLRHVTVRYGGDWDLIAYSDITVRNVVAGEVRLESSRVGPVTGGTSAAYGLYVSNSRVVISDTVFSSIGNSTSDYPLRIAADSLHQTELVSVTLQGNTVNRPLLGAGTIPGDATLRPLTQYDAYELEDDVVLAGGATLTVEPGVVIKGRSAAELKVLGHLQAVGTAAEPILFTSVANTGPAQWPGLIFDGGTGHLSYVTVRYAGYLNTISGSYASSIWVRNVTAGQVRLEHSQVLSGTHLYATNPEYGLYIENSHLVISDTLFRNNCNQATNDYTIYATGASSVVTVTDSSLLNNKGYGLFASSGVRLQVSGSTFSGNGHYPLRTDLANLPQITNNTISENATNRILVSGGTLATDLSLSPQGEAAYEMDDSITVAAGVTLTMEPGTTLMGQSNGQLKVQGRLEAVGTPAQPITFTSATDTGPAQWWGLVLLGGTGELRHVTVRYGGQNNGYASSNVAVVNVSAGQVRIESSRIMDCYSTSVYEYGVYVSNGRATVSDTLFVRNGNHTAYDFALYSTGSSVITVTGNTFQNNAGYAVRLGGTIRRMDGNTFSNNGVNRIRLAAATVGGSLALVEQAGLEGYEFEGDLTVAAAGTLSVEPGLALVMQPWAKLLVYGNLQALGTPTRPITFGVASASNQWTGIVFSGGSGHLRHALVRYGGYTWNPGVGSLSGNVIVYGVSAGEVVIESSRLMGSRNDGMTVYNGRAVISDTLFSDHGAYTTDAALYVTGASSAVTVTNSTFSGNACRGIDSDGSASLWVSGSTFSANSAYPLRTEARNLHRVLEGNTFSGNTPNRLVTYGTMLAGATLPAGNGLAGYELENTLTVPAGATLTVEPGVTVLGREGYDGLTVVGRLVALGTATEPITFTSANNTAPATWGGILFNSGTGHLRQVTVRYGGGQAYYFGPSEGSYYGNVILRGMTQAGVQIEDSRIVNGHDPFSNNDAGLLVVNGRVSVSNTIFSGNGNGSSADAAIYASAAGSVVTVTNCTIVSNNAYGVYTKDGLTLRVEDSAVESNSKQPLRTDPVNLHRVLTTNTFAGNTPNRAIIASGSLATDAELVSNGLVGYELEGVLTVPAGMTLTVPAGMTVMGKESAFLQVLGYLRAVGSVEQPILFTSLTNTGANQWGGVGIDGGRGELRYVTVRYGGRALNPWMSNITVRNGRLVLANAQVLSERSAYTSQWDGGLIVENGQVTVSDTLFSGNGSTWYDGAVVARGGNTLVTIADSALVGNSACGFILDTGARVIARHSSVHSNSDYDVRNPGGSSLSDLRYNWWGQSPPAAGEFLNTPPVYAPWIVTGTFAAGYYPLADDVYEPNDGFASAGLAQVNSTLAAFLDPRGDVDHYRLEIKEEGTLLAVADASGTTLAPQVKLYDLSQTLLNSVSGAAGAVVTATAAVQPGVYMVRVSGDNSVTGGSSYLPYRLRLLQADPRAGLIDQTVGQGGRTYAFGTFPVSLAPGASTSLAATAPPSLTVPGGYYLRGRLINTRSQVLDESVSSFFLSDNPLALTLATDQAAYRPDQAVTVTGRVHNAGPTPVGPETLTLARDGVSFYTATISLPAGGAQEFSAISAAPSVSGEFTLTGQISTTTVVAVIPVAEPEVDIALDAPDLVLPGPFVVELALANNGQVPVSLELDWGPVEHLNLAPGALADLTQTLAISQPIDLVVRLTGDLTETMTQTIGYSPAPSLTLSPDDLQHEGDVVIPYRLVNPGSVDLEALVLFDLGEPEPYDRLGASRGAIDLAPADRPALQRQGVAWLAVQQASGTIVTRTHTLPAGGILTDTLVVSLTRGVRPVEATLRIDQSLNPSLFSHRVADAWTQVLSRTVAVRGEDDLRLNASGAPTVTVVITNVGWNAFSGTLRAVGWRDGVFASHEQDIAVPVNASQPFTLALDTSELSPGPYTATLEVRADTSALLHSAVVTGVVPAPAWSIRQLPAQTTLLSDQVVTLPFTVANQGGAPDLANVHLALGDLTDETQARWVAAGATAAFSYTVYLPLDMPSQELVGRLTVTSTHDSQGDARLVSFHVEGISLAVQAGTDRPAYLEGDPFTAILTVTNAGSRDTGGLTALMAFNGITQTRPVSLTPGAAVVLTFPYTATFLADRKLFYGLYGQFADRGAYLNTLYLYPENLGVTLQLDRQVYLPGQTIQTTVITTLTQGMLTLFAFGESYTQTLAGGPGPTFAVPGDAERGSYAIYTVVHGCDCAADGREQATWFDVAAPWVRVVESQLGQGPYQSGSQVSATLTIASEVEQDIALHTWLRYPDGRDGAASSNPVHLLGRLDNQAVVTAVITGSQMGLHQLLYDLALPGTLDGSAQGSRPAQVDGAEGFDLGPAGLDRVATDRLAYTSTLETVQVALDIFSPSGGPAGLVLDLDAGPTTSQTVSLSPGYQTLQLPLDGPLPAGNRVLTATLLMEGYRAWHQTGFAFGTSLPDLRPGSPWVEPGGLVTRTVAAVVSNEGAGDAPTTMARFYDGDPVLGGSLLATVPVDPVVAGAQTVVSATWNIQGQGGEHLLYLAVDPAGEFDEANNEAQAAVTLPRLDAGLSIEPLTIVAGEPVTLVTSLENLQAAVTLPVTVAVEVRSPLAVVVYSRTQAVVLAGGEGQSLTHLWPGDPGLEPGRYSVIQQAWDGHGELLLDPGSFTVSPAPEPCHGLTGVAVVGPVEGVPGMVYTFTATAGPVTATLPITFTWQAPGQGQVVHLVWGLTDTMTYTWSTAGTMTITLSASNCGNAVATSHRIVIEQQQWRLYLPLLIKG